MHEKSITLLNKAVADEMSAVHQYMYFHFHELDNMDKFGANYLAPQSIERSKTRAASIPPTEQR